MNDSLVWNCVGGVCGELNLSVIYPSATVTEVNGIYTEAFRLAGGYPVLIFWLLVLGFVAGVLSIAGRMWGLKLPGRLEYVRDEFGVISVMMIGFVMVLMYPLIWGLSVEDVYKIFPIVKGVVYVGVGLLVGGWLWKKRLVFKSVGVQLANTNLDDEDSEITIGEQQSLNEEKTKVETMEAVGVSEKAEATSIFPNGVCSEAPVASTKEGEKDG